MFNMFGAKPFSTPFAASTSTFGASTPFGGNTSTFTAKTTGTSAGFSTPGFGSNTPAPTGGLFGQNTSSSTTTGLFGGGQQTTTFGGSQNTGFTFGSTPSASGGLFGQNNQSTGGGLFATPVSNTAFGAKTPGFSGFSATGNAASTGSTLFGAQSSGSSLFGQTSGFASTATSGTTVKFNPPNGQDTIVKNGVTTNINTKHQCITAMKEYENKSIEELRLEDYVANRKGKQQQAVGSLFGTTPATQTTGFNFGGASSGTGFGTSGGFGTSTGTSLFGQQQSTSLFGQQNKTAFGTTTAASTGLGFGTNTGTGTSLFGQQQKPVGLFGTNPVTTQSSLFGAGTGTTFGSTSTFQPTAFGTPQQQNTGLFAQKLPAFGTSTAGSTGFSFNAGSSQGSSNLFAKPLSNNTFTGFNTASTATSGFGTSGGGLFNTSKPGTFGFNTTTSAPSFGFGTGMSTGTNLFGNTQSKPAFGNLGTTTGNTAFGSGFNAPNFNLGGITSTLGQTSGPSTTSSNTVQLQQTILALAHSPYGDSPLFRNIKPTSTKLEDVLKPTNPAAQKAALAQTGLYKVSNRPTAKVKPKSIHGILNGGKSQLFDGLEDDDFSFGNDTFVPRKSVKKLVIKKTGENDSSIRSRASSIAEESPSPQIEPVAIQHSTFISRSTPDHITQQNVEEERLDTENIIRSKEMPDPISDTPNKDMDDTIALLNVRNKVISQEPSMKLQDTSVLSHSSASENDSMDERPTTPPPPHPAGVVLRRPGYFTVPNLEELAELVDENGDCFVEDFTIARDGYGSIYFPGVTNVANLNLDDIVFFRRKEVVVYPDDDNKPPVGEGLNKKAEITLDCVWPRDKSVGTPIKDAEKLKAMKWQDKLEENSLRNGAKFVDYRPETGSWVFEVKHFSKYGLLDDSDDEDLSEQEKKKLRSTQQHQLTVQKQKVQVEELKQKEGQEKSGGHVTHRFIVGGDDDDDDDDDMTPIRREVPMTDDDSEMPDITRERLPDHMLEMSDDLHDDNSMVVQPSSHRQATRMGVSVRDMQVMKASFFDDEELPESAFGSQMFGQKKTGTQSPVTVHRDSGLPSLFSSALKSKIMSPVKLPSLPLSESQREGRGIYSPRMITPEPIRPLPPSFQPPVAEHLALASGLTAKDMPRKIVGSRIQRAIPMPEESYSYQKQHLLVDAGLFMGRSFRVGWGPNWTLANCGSPILGVSSDKKDEMQAGTLSLFSSGHKRATTINNITQWKVSVEKLHVADYLREEDKMVQHNHEEMLLIQLDHSKSNMENGCPVFAPAMGVEALHQYAKQIKEDIAKTGSHPDAQTLHHMRDVWELCVALWGKLTEFMDMDVEEDSYLYHQARQEAVSNWLADTAIDVIKREIQTVKYEDQGYLKAILSSLTGRQIANACGLAQKSGDHRLALLLAEPIGSQEPRQMLDQQIEEWQELNANPFFKLARNKIYSLLAGKLVLQTREGQINTCEGLDWKRALALHLWYHCRANSTILEALEEYDRSFSGDEPYTQAPVPPYVETDEDSLIDIRHNAVFDTCYHLLKLYCRRSHQLEITLNPVTSTINQTDYRLSWHLSQVLQSLSYTHLSSFHRASLHMNFASQLEALDMWEWAVFVTLHIEDRTGRESAVRCILNRYITLSKEESYLSKENFLKEKLKIPVEWIHHAKALRARHEGKPQDEAYHLLKAGLWNQSHMIIIEHIAPDAIISENYDYLLKFLVELSTPPSRCETIQDWHRGGLIYLDYINLCNARDKIKQSGKTDSREMDRLQEELKNLCLRVGSIQCRNSRDRLCQSEMAKKAAVLLRSTGHAQPSARLLASVISGLPMPEDYSLQELNALTRSFILEQTA
ncbi:hypothetical protein CHS0354_019194 [Potamilus streckersoni]|uniref:Nuclear pore complex protein Nup98-Nup96 n=1 Tax=Potamilus streckersoni TaxID=2493646 RepID=A0AAE0SBX9_9BIVA|nr:hypothetical protein CHS0354_019194 [Potamilus streckersoni]